jgi:uncharacterized protein YlxP (DUF503 family)
MSRMSRGVAALAGADLHDHVVLLGVLLVARDLATAEHALERARDHIDVDTPVGRAVAIDAPQARACSA